MSIAAGSIWAASPSTNRGQPTILSTDPKGERIAYASNKSIFLRTIDHPEIASQYSQHKAQTTVARFAPSGFYVASGDVTGNVRVWDCQGEGTTKGEYNIIAGRINDIAWDGESKRLIAVGHGRERFGHCITADSGNSIGEISGHSSQINCVAIRQQRPLRAATGSDDTSVGFFHGAPFKFNTSLRESHNKFIYGVAFSPDGNFLVSVGSDRKIWLYDGQTGSPTQQIGHDAHAGSIFGVSWSGDSKSFVTASADQTVKIWDTEYGKEVQSWRMGENLSIPDQQMGVVWPHRRSDGLIISVNLDGDLNFLAKGSEEPRQIIRGHQKNITAADLTSGVGKRGETLWTGSSEGRVRAWNVGSGTCASVDGEGHSNYASSISSAPEGSRLFTAGWDDKIRIIDTAAEAFLGDGKSSTNGQPQCIAAVSNNHVLAATPSGIEVHRDGNLVQTFKTESFSSRYIAFSRGHNRLAVTSDDKSLRLYALTEDDKIVPEVTLENILSAPGSALAFSRDGAHLAVGTTSGGISVFETTQWSLITSRWSAHTARVTCIAWSKDDKFAASGSLDTNVFVWSLHKPGMRVKMANAHKDGVNAIVWEEKLFSAGTDAAIKQWTVDGLS